jgi:hypothetical protein
MANRLIIGRNLNLTMNKLLLGCFSFSVLLVASCRSQPAVGTVTMKQWDGSGWADRLVTSNTTGYLTIDGTNGLVFSSTNLFAAGFPIVGNRVSMTNSSAGNFQVTVGQALGKAGLTLAENGSRAVLFSADAAYDRTQLLLLPNRATFSFAEVYDIPVFGIASDTTANAAVPYGLLSTSLSAKQDLLTAGPGITLSGGTISANATGTSTFPIIGDEASITNFAPGHLLIETTGNTYITGSHYQIKTTQGSDKGAQFTTPYEDNYEQRSSVTLWKNRATLSGASINLGLGSSGTFTGATFSRSTDIAGQDTSIVVRGILADTGSTSAVNYRQLSQKQDLLTAGDNITIVDGTISATGGGSAGFPIVESGSMGSVTYTHSIYTSTAGYLPAMYFSSSSNMQLGATYLRLSDANFELSAYAGKISTREIDDFLTITANNALKLKTPYSGYPDATIDIVVASPTRLVTPGGTIAYTSDITGISPWTVSGSNIYYTAGNVGIGTTNPTVPLQVSGNAVFGSNWPSTNLQQAPLNMLNGAASAIKTQLNLFNTAGGGGAGSAIDFITTPEGNSNPGARIVGVDDGNFAAHFDIYTKTPGSGGSGALNRRLRVHTNGNIGLGVDTPAYKLDVAGDINLTGDIRKNGVIWNPSGGGFPINGNEVRITNPGAEQLLLESFDQEIGQLGFVKFTGITDMLGKIEAGVSGNTGFLSYMDASDFYTILGSRSSSIATFTQVVGEDIRVISGGAVVINSGENLTFNAPSGAIKDRAVNIDSVGSNSFSVVAGADAASVGGQSVGSLTAKSKNSISIQSGTSTSLVAGQRISLNAPALTLVGATTSFTAATGSFSPGFYASSTKAGVVKVGGGLSIDSNGVLSASGGGGGGGFPVTGSNVIISATGSQLESLLAVDFNSYIEGDVPYGQPKIRLKAVSMGSDGIQIPGKVILNGEGVFASPYSGTSISNMGPEGVYIDGVRQGRPLRIIPTNADWPAGYKKIPPGTYFLTYPNLELSLLLVYILDTQTEPEAQTWTFYSTWPGTISEVYGSPEMPQFIGRGFGNTGNFITYAGSQRFAFSDRAAFTVTYLGDSSTYMVYGFGFNTPPPDE